MARFQFMPRTQRALADDDLVRVAARWRRLVAAFPGGGVVGMACLPGALFAIAVTSRFDSVLAEKARGMPPWLRVGTGLCFVSGAVMNP